MIVYSWWALIGIVTVTKIFVRILIFEESFLSRIMVTFGPRPSKRQGYMIMNKEPNGITNDSRGLYKAWAGWAGPRFFDSARLRSK